MDLKFSLLEGFVTRGTISGEKVLVFCPIICRVIAFVAELTPYVS
jgi:hypothetical protein